MSKELDTHIGTAGWSYADWDGCVYPKPKPTRFHGLSFLMDYFDCVEVNSTFYGVPRQAVVRGWSKRVGKCDFRFIVKLLRSLTHGGVHYTNEELQAPVTEFLQSLQPLRQAKQLGALLVQFAHSFGCTRNNRLFLGRLLRAVSQAGDPLVLELRHRSWFAASMLQSFFTELGHELNVSLAHVDMPAAPDHPPAEFQPFGKIGYLRLHGRNSEAWFSSHATRDERYDYLYSESELKALADRVRRLSTEADETYVVTNNHFAGKAFANALEFQRLLGQSPALAPKQLLDHYPRLGEFLRARGQADLFG